MEISWEIILFVLVIFTSAMFRSTFGFGDALISMPLLAMFISIKTATPIVAFTGFFISIVILITNKNSFNIKKVWHLIIFSLLGIPLGVLFLRDTHDDLVKTVLATMLILFAIYRIINPDLRKLKTNKFSWLFGIISGALGGAYNTNGPPIIIYGSLKKWEPEEFRILLQGIFLPTNFFIILGHGLAGFWTSTVWIYFLITLPLIILAIFIGTKLNNKISREKFDRLIYFFLLVIGIILLIKTYF
ncbi:MAG: sulfite exporter TauE/SafE family protein [bacterium]